jgi:hypothetical protein
MCRPRDGQEGIVIEGAVGAVIAAREGPCRAKTNEGLLMLEKQCVTFESSNDMFIPNSQSLEVYF